MQEHATEQELKDRLSLIENMIAEGRRTTERWGWTFVLWGVAFYLAIFLCQILFGIYGMIADAQGRKRRQTHESPAHA